MSDEDTPRRDTRFQKGRSGNPKGRPKKLRGVSALDEAMLTKVSLTMNGRRKDVPLIFAHVVSVGQRALAGDKYYVGQLNKLAMMCGLSVGEPQALQPSPSIQILPVRPHRADHGNLSTKVRGTADDEDN